MAAMPQTPSDVASSEVDGPGSDVLGNANPGDDVPEVEMLAVWSLLPRREQALTPEEWAALAEGWGEMAESWARTETPKGARVAGWSYALATAALVEANSLRAYETWPLAISWLADAGARWRDEQARFRTWLTMPEETDLGRLAREIDETLGLAAFDGPPQGLGDPWWGPEPSVPALSVPAPSVPALPVSAPPALTPSVPDTSTPDLPGPDTSIATPRKAGQEPAPEPASTNEAAAEPASRGSDLGADAHEESAHEVGLQPTALDLLPQGRVETHSLDVLDIPPPPPSAASEPDASRATEALPEPWGHAPPRSGLTEEDRVLIRTAWAYFARNRQPTDLVNSVDGYPYTTLWDVASTIAAIHAAHELGVLPSTEATNWLESLLQALREMPLYRDELPNREYDTRDGSIANTGSVKLAGGTGWSALDLGRLLIWLRIVADAYPSLEPSVSELVASWRFERLSQDGQLNGVRFTGKQELLRQEGRLGYEQYAARGFALWGYEVERAVDYDRIQVGLVDGVEVPYDERNLAFLTSDPFVLAAIELGGGDQAFQILAETIFAVQLARWQREGTITAAGEDALDQRPWFLYNNILFEGEAWHAVSHRGVAHRDLFGWSAKGALGWWALNLEPTYGQALRESVQKLARAGRGVYAGMLDSGTINRSLNVNTNAVILEIMLYIARGGRPMIELDPAASAQ